MRKPNPECKYCGHYPKEINEKYDSYYCGVCNSWLEDICSDKDCHFCKDRPEKPLEN